MKIVTRLGPPNLRPPVQTEFDDQPKPWLDEHDACAIFASVRRSGEATHGNLKRAMDALSKMGHRSGSVNGEGDGCGVLTDIPRRLWAAALEEEGKPAWLAEDRRFFVGHFMVPAGGAGPQSAWQDAVLDLLIRAGADVLISREGQTRPQTLGRFARAQAPLFWQVAGLLGRGALETVESRLFELALAVERETPVHTASLSSYTVVYKVRGSIETLYQYYPELRSPDYLTAITLGHSRYSTNTTTAFERVQPFALLGHNGEINTIARLREQARMLDIPLVPGGSDSQDVDRLMAGLIHRYGVTLTEAIELLFPPILSEVEKLDPSLEQVYQYLRQALGPYAQGPAAIIARYGDHCVFSVDALGLRPLWFGETEKEFYFSSEKGVFNLDSLCSQPRPLSPGEKMELHLVRSRDVQVFDYPALQERLQQRVRRRLGIEPHVPFRISVPAESLAPKASPGPFAPQEPVPSVLQFERRLAAMGWSREDRDWIQSLAGSGSEPIGSLGYDGPLAALSPERQNLADYFKEAVAVVTNPSIDRERETEHFSTQSLLGARPPLDPSGPDFAIPLPVDNPVLLGGHLGPAPLLADDYRRVAAQSGCLLLEDLPASFPSGQVARLTAAHRPGETIPAALERLAAEACQAVSAGARLLVLDDASVFRDGQGWIDPLLVVAGVDRALRSSFLPARQTSIQASENGKRRNGSSPAGGDVAPAESPAPVRLNLRRQAGLVLRSGAVRNLHDLILALGLGADAVAPYLLFEVALDDLAGQLTPQARAERLANTVQALRIGLEKVISTMGIHELRGYGRLFASIGLRRQVASFLNIQNYAGSDEGGLSWDDLDAVSVERTALFTGDTPGRLSREPRFYPKVWKIAGQVSRGEADPGAFEAAAENLAAQLPIALRHILDFGPPDTGTRQISPGRVDAGLTGHDLPFVIASMSFGSQGETAFRAYAEAAHRLNMIALNGEGGEIHDMLGLYPHNRGQQIASGRFGVSAELINSSNLLEIKIGQGAKPGEGGHLPGRKVTSIIAAARHASPGVDLISPSNNHDIYSIEDLAQFIEELKTCNPKARVAVKVPVVPGIGLIAVGIAKAGADIINLSGFDGGTGAARQHALRHVGLPAEIGVVESHRALTASGLRSKVEIWCDGGIRTAADVVKMICLGANRVGFGTLAMVAVGCTICRDCQTGTCHVGITTQLKTVEEAQKLGLRRFVPCSHAPAVEGLVNLFNALGAGVRLLTAQLGFTRTQDLVGRSDLLRQISHTARLDLRPLLAPAIAGAGEPETLPAASHAAVSAGALVRELAAAGAGPLRRPRNHLTTVISDLVMETVAAGEAWVSFEDDKVTPVDRALGTHLTGALVRYRRAWNWHPGHGGVGGKQESWRPPLNGHGQVPGNGNGNGSSVSPIVPPAAYPPDQGNGNGNEHSNGSEHSNGNGHHLRAATLRFYASSVPGNGLGAYNTAPLDIVVEGGAQDGVAKGMLGGRVIILKGYNHDGRLIGGSVGKSLAYGAIGGLIIVQGDADSRACIRLSGADVIIGGEIRQPLNDSLGFLGARANVKGFLCEYMTSGRVVVLGDPGPWICSGMTGGVLYLRLQPHMNFDEHAVRRRLARSAKVSLTPLETHDHDHLEELLSEYALELAHNHQSAQARKIEALLLDMEQFVKIEALKRQLDQSIATE